MATTGTARPSLFKETAHTRSRRRAELRLRLYGLVAIAAAFLALATLLGTVVMQAAGALTESYITLDVAIDDARIDPDGDRDPKTILRADFAGLTKELLKDTFPQVTSRGDRRELYDLVSSGASFELAEMVSANPGLVGQTVEFDFLASDVADLYLKGSYGQLNVLDVSGELTLKLDGDSAELASTAPDFADSLASIKDGLMIVAARLRRQAQLQDNGVREFARRAAEAADDAVREAAEVQVAARTAARDKLVADAAALETRARSAGGFEEIGDTQPALFVKLGGGWIRLTGIGETTAHGEVLAPVAGDTGDWRLLATDMPERSRKVSDKQIVWIEMLRDLGAVREVFNTRFFTAADSREPELAGIRGATVGTFWTMLVTFVLSFPVGVLAAIYLEEFAPKNRITRLIEVNINNLAAVPSIVFGLLGLGVFLQFFGMPRSAPIAGGAVMALMTLPTIIIASRVSIAAVPPSIREAALGVGASAVQTSFHHVLPLAMPGILTGAILGMARALGETAPLILIGMVAFIVEIPTGITDSATVLPVQIYRWSDFPERAFEMRTAAAICVLLVFLVAMNAVAVILRRKFERRW